LAVRAAELSGAVVTAIDVLGQGALRVGTVGLIEFDQAGEGLGVGGQGQDGAEQNDGE
jgi:hypothetical protein